MATHSSILPGKSHGQRSLEDYSAWDCKESDMTERLDNNNSVCVCVRVRACMCMLSETVCLISISCETNFPNPIPQVIAVPLIS